MKHSTRIILWIGVIALLCVLSGCALINGSVQQNIPEDVAELVTPAPTAEPTPEPTAEEIIIAAPETPDLPTLPPTPTPTPTPEPTEVPTPSPIPFSYYCPTVNMSFEELVGSLPDFDESNPQSTAKFIMPKGYPNPDTYRIVVDLYWQIVAVYSKDPDTGEYTVPVRYMTCASGDPRKYHETQTGTFQMKPTKVRFGNFKTGETAQYWSLIRSRTYFHSTIYSKHRDLSSVDKASYEAVTSGTKASHACIRLLVPDARWIYYNICYDTTCEIRKGSKDDADMAAIREQMHFAAWKDNADLSTANTPYTDNWTIEDVPIEKPYVHATQPPVPKS